MSSKQERFAAATHSERPINHLSGLGTRLALPIPGSVAAARSPFIRIMEEWRSSILLEL
jgi:hypothetical protein